MPAWPFLETSPLGLVFAGMTARKIRSSILSRSSLGAQDRQGREGSAERAARRHAPPAVERSRVDAAKIDGVARVAVARKAIERRLLAIHSARHAPAQRKVRARRAVIGAVR